MSNQFSARSWWLVLLIGGLAFAGCASLKTIDIQPVAPVAHVQSESQSGWWSVQIQWYWPEGTVPAWHLDLLAAHQVLLPAIKANEDGILLWRIHRRASRDEAGHQLSLLFHASRLTAQTIYASIADDAILADLAGAGLLRQVHTKPLAEGLQPNVADTSDPAWSPAMQACWPDYIHGVSQMWLNLVSITANPMITDSAPNTIHETVALYRRVDSEINAIWQMEAHHALLHHLNAVFGYQPIPIRF